MTLITSQNPIRFAIDSLSAKKTGVISSTSNAPVNLGRAKSVNSISVKGSQPAGTYRYFAFCIDNTWGRLTTSGTFSPFAENHTDYDNLESNGNTPAELTALTNIPALAGKSFGVAIALAADDADNALPSCGLEFNCANDTQQLTAAETSPIYELGQDSQIISLNAETSTEKGGSVTLSARYTANNGTSSDWLPLERLSGVKARTVQLKADYRAQTVGQSRAKVDKASVVYADGNIISGMTSGEIITKSIDWYMPVKNCRLTINHAPLEKSTIKAYAAFRTSPVHVESEQLGIGSGARKTFQLANTNGLKYDSLKLFFDSSQVFTDYEFNTEAGRVTCTAPEGVIVSASYDYGWDLENWQEMTLSSRLAMDGYDKSEYRLSDAGNNKSVAAIRIILGMTSGRITNELLGTGSGKAKSFKLSHIVNAGNISITAGGAALAAKFYSLADDGQYISIAAPAGQVLRASYEWISEPPIIYQYAAVFSE